MMKLGSEGKINGKIVNGEIVEQHQLIDNKKAYLLTDWRDMCDINLGQSTAYSSVNAEWPMNCIVKGLNNQGLMLSYVIDGDKDMEFVQ